MAQVQVTRTLNAQSEFARRARRAGKAKAKGLVDKIGQRAVELAEKQIREDFITDRPPKRRHAGSRRLAGSMRYEVTTRGDETFPYVIRLYSRANAAKVNSLEQGAQPHTISTWKVGGLWLPEKKAGQKLSRTEQAYTTTKRPVGQSVEHRGNKKYGFMRSSLERAASEALGRAVVAKRRQGA